MKQWERFQEYLYADTATGFLVDISRMNFPDNYFESLEPAIRGAFDAMQALENGIVANPDEKRQVGHYWLRKPILAPDAQIRAQVEAMVTSVKEFAHQVHSGQLAPKSGGSYKHILLIGIGGSALGPQFLNRALGSAADAMDCFFFDNTDPDGMTNALTRIPDLSKTICLVISKSGGTKETRNGMLIAQAAWRAAGLDFAKNAVAVTGAGSELDRLAEAQGWLARFPMWDWVGGRTSVFSAVGLLGAALQGFDIDALLKGAREMDESTRRKDAHSNPAALLALMWYFAGRGKGEHEMVILPYNDRLELFSRYLQQLIMESLGKERDLEGRIVHQGLTVFGNKGSTDQHAYVQQLRDGLNNFFVTFVEVLKDTSLKTARDAKHAPFGLECAAVEVEPGVFAGDFLSGFFQGTRKALHENGRQSITITVPEVSEYTVGALIALFDRAVGLYASLININAYHQPGVEAGKKAAQRVIELQGKVVALLKENKSALTLEEIAQALGEQANIESIYLTLRHMAANQRIASKAGANLFDARYALV